MRGVFKSTNGGGAWSAVNTGLTDYYCLRPGDRPGDSEHALCGDMGRRRVQEHERRRAWSAVNTGLTATTVYALAIDPATPSTLYAGTWGGGVFKSTNGGAAWSAVNTGLTDHLHSRPGD